MHDIALKHVARESAEKAGVPVLKGSGLVESPEEAVEAAQVIGYPVLLKATGGGGGRCGGISWEFEKIELEARHKDGCRSVHQALNATSAFECCLDVMAALSTRIFSAATLHPATHRGIYICQDADEVRSQFHVSQKQGEAFFGNSGVSSRFRGGAASKLPVRGWADVI